MRFAIFRPCLDAAMKDATHEGISLETTKEEKEAVTDEEEDLFWSKGLLGCGRAKSLLNTVYYYNGKRAQEIEFKEFRVRSQLY